jgi:hypothetical protein
LRCFDHQRVLSKCSHKTAPGNQRREQRRQEAPGIWPLKLVGQLVRGTDVRTWRNDAVDLNVTGLGCLPFSKTATGRTIRRDGLFWQSSSGEW